MSPVRRVRVVAAIVFTAAVLAACGGGSSPTVAGGSTAPPSATTAADNGVANLPATAILTRAQDALRRATSVHIKGGGFSQGEQFALDMRLGPDRATGTVTTNGQPIELRRVSSTLYIKSSPAFWQTLGGAAAAELMKGRYLKVPTTNPEFAEVVGFTDLKKSVNDLLTPSGTVTKGNRKTIRGMEAIGLVDSSKDGGTLYIATHGEPYPLSIVASGKTDDSGSLDFLEYGVPVTVQAPPEDQVVDVSKLGGH
jgi:hypothetical protein